MEKIDKIKSKIFSKYTIDFRGNKKKFSHLKCHLDLKLFYGFLKEIYLESCGFRVSNNLERKT